MNGQTNVRLFKRLLREQIPNLTPFKRFDKGGFSFKEPKKILVDAMIFIGKFLGTYATRSGYPIGLANTKFLNKIENERDNYELYISLYTLGIISHVLSSAKTRLTYMQIKQEISKLKNKYKISYFVKDDYEKSFEIMEENKTLDFEDSIQLRAALKEGCDTIITRDAHFLSIAKKYKLNILEPEFLIEEYKTKTFFYKPPENVKILLKSLGLW